jgi:hypothetical protein
MKPASEAQQKQFYKPPKLVVYGDLVEMTRSKPTGGNSENMHGHGGNPKT